VNKTPTKMARPRCKNTDYGKGSFGREQLDFQSMTTESFAKSKLKKGGSSPYKSYQFGSGTSRLIRYPVRYILDFRLT